MLCDEGMVSCPDCDGAALAFGDRASGICHVCHGEGEALSDQIISGIANSDDDDTPLCYECNGTGTCQTCGGEGQVEEE
jgi:DnaJ-class molecular chaperone